MWTYIIIILALLYALNPYDLLPDVLVGWGWLDDLIILGFIWRYFYKQKKKRQAYQKRYQHSRKAHDGSRGAEGGSGAQSYTENREFTDHWDPHRTLGIEKGASPDEIKSAYRRLALKYHPDKLEHLGDEFKVLAEKRFKEIQEAYQKLMPK